MVDDFADRDELALDERPRSPAGRGSESSSRLPVAGVQYTELPPRPPAPPHRRAHTTTEKRDAADRLGRAVLTMLDADLVVEPTPRGRTAACPFRAPCLAMNRGEDPDAAARRRDYRRRPVDMLEEGRLGGVSWGMGRGAAPPHLRGADAGGGEGP